MRNLETTEVASVAGGDSVDANLGAGIAIVLHGITSAEAKAFGMASPMGWIVGATVHYATTH